MKLKKYSEKKTLRKIKKVLKKYGTKNVIFSVRYKGNKKAIPLKYFNLEDLRDKIKSPTLEVISFVVLMKKDLIEIKHLNK